MAPNLDPRGGVGTATRDRPRLPTARGPVSDAVIDALAHDRRTVLTRRVEGLDLLEDDDAQLALTCCYELHYESFVGVSDRWEWDPGLLTLRRSIEDAFLARLADEVGLPSPLAGRDVVPALQQLTTGSTAPSLSRYMEREGSLEQMREFCVHRSAYQLKEADPHTWMIPRLRGRAKAAAVAIQYDEYGEGSAPAMHAELFATTMRAIGLDATYGAYLDLLPGSTLATENLVTMFGLRRELRAACVGHLALFEMTSVGPMARYEAALRRMGIGPDARRFYSVHVEADAWHEIVAQAELVGGILESEPDAGGQVLFGARALMEVERRMTEALLGAWRVGSTALLAPLPSTHALAS